MSKFLPLFILAITVITGCAQKHTNSKSSHTLNCILLGYDSLAFYYGNSDRMYRLERGKVTDSAFMNKLMTEAKEQVADSSFHIKIKPTASADIANNIRELVDLLNENDLQNRSIDTLDENEKMTFHATSMQELVDLLTIRPDPVRLQFPKDDDTIRLKKDSLLPAKALVGIVLGGNDIYAYKSPGIQSGKIYTYEEWKKYLLVNKSEDNLTVLIKSSKNGTYKNVVDVLDQMVELGIEKYSLVDISKAEENYINTFIKK